MEVKNLRAGRLTKILLPFWKNVAQNDKDRWYERKVERHDK